ncbi:hypothetical protein H2200_006608 [Cladophialophora chaetospira]|uniref:IBR domain-containing protein n=1 Tax=Cladophialophora chaetospira TaxID=386627 RepID=A0AA38X937_9EURO|nr:hypothetical protein H2200_006608 [Cladophialophora chaetospira]
MVEKTDGCNHMDCVCGVEFCYRCGHLFDEDDSCECEPQWDEELEDEEDEDEDEDDSEEDEDDDSDEWPDYRVAVDPAGRIKCLHLHAAPLASESDSSGDESMRIDVPRETRVGGLSRTQNLL